MKSATTFEEVLSLAGVSVPAELEAEATVPVLSGPQRQGDIYIVPARASRGGTWETVGPEGIVLVRGEATGNTHVLHADGPVQFKRAPEIEGEVILGELVVPAGSIAWLIHTDEHGCNGIGDVNAPFSTTVTKPGRNAGAYRMHGKREQADTIRRVAD